MLWLCGAKQDALRNHNSHLESVRASLTCQLSRVEKKKRRKANRDKETHWPLPSHRGTVLCDCGPVGPRPPLQLSRYSWKTPLGFSLFSCMLVPPCPTERTFSLINCSLWPLNANPMTRMRQAGTCQVFENENEGREREATLALFSSLSRSVTMRCDTTPPQWMTMHDTVPCLLVTTFYTRNGKLVVILDRNLET